MKEVQVGVNSPHAAHSAMGSGHCHQGSWALHRMLHKKGNSVFRSSQKSKTTAKIYWEQSRKQRKKLFPTAGETAAVSTPTLREMYLRLENRPSWSIPPSWRQDQTDLWSGPIWRLCVRFLRKLLLGSYGEAVSPHGQLAGRTATLSVAMTLGLCTFPQLSNHGQCWRSNRPVLYFLMNTN